MATLGFEVRHEAHLQNSTQWNGQQGRSVTTNSASTGGRSDSATNLAGRGKTTPMRDSTTIIDRSKTRYEYGNSYGDDNKSTASSRFSDDTGSGLSEGTSYSERMRRKRKCAMRMIASYICVAGLVFMGVVLWRMGFLFQDVDSSYSAVRGSSTTGGFDESGNMICNGLALNCHRRANEIMYATVHNAMSSRENSFLAYNNLFQLEDALMAGFRGLTMDSCDCARIGIQLCHGVCIAGFRRPIATFTAIVDFMKKNAHEVVILEIEVGDESLGPLFDDLQQIEGFSDLMYQHPGGDEEWPKLKEMIEMDKRLIIFAHNDIGCEEDGDCPAGVHPTFDYAFETPFGQRGASQLMKNEETCSVSRGWSNSDFVISNHFAANNQGLPDINVAAVTNAALNLQLRLDACQDEFSTKYGQDVINLLVVDFWSVGDTLEVVHKYNSALPAKTHAPSASPSLAPTSASDKTTAPKPTTGEPATVTSEPSAHTITSIPTIRPSASTTTAALTLVPSTSPSLTLTATPTLASPTTTPSATPSLSIASLFDTILNVPQPAPTATAIEIPSTSNMTSNSSLPLFGGDTNFVSSTTTPSPTFAATEEPPNSDFLPGSEMLLSVFADGSETLEPTVEGTDGTEREDEQNGQHAVFALEKDPGRSP